MKNKIIIFLLIILSFCLVGCNDIPLIDDPIIDDEKKEEEEDEYTNVVYLDESGKTLSSSLIIQGSTFDLMDVPKKEYYDGEWINTLYTSEIIVYQAKYTLNQTTFTINYNVSVDKLLYSSKEEMVRCFLLDFYDFVSPNEELVTFLYGLDLTKEASLENGHYTTYFGGTYGSLNKLLYNNDIDANNDNYFFNSSKYKDKWYHLSSYVRDNICKSNKRFGYSEGNYTYGALDFYRYLMSIPGTYIQTYGGDSIFYGYPKANYSFKESYTTQNNEYIMNAYNPNFLGWYKNSDCTGERIEDLNDCVGNLNLYPKWKNEDTYTIYYKDSNGIILDEANVRINDSINLPTMERNGAKFLGWFLQNGHVNNFIYQYDCDMTLVAKWNYDDVNDLINIEYDGTTVYYNDTYQAVTIYEDYVEKEEGGKELRATWVSSFVGGFTPSKNEATMKAELTKILNIFESYNINCIFFHLRSHNNAYYKTMLAPTTSINNSEYGTYADFLNFDYVPWLIEECHKRGIEFHAWLNPYRIANNNLPLNVTADDVAKDYEDFPLNPASKSENILITYGNKEGTRGAILNPAKKEVQDYLVDVVEELMNNYDIDGIHFDDYFYAKINDVAGILDDDDQQDYLDYLKLFSSIRLPSEEGKADWRRKNVTTLIKKLHNAISEFNKENNTTIQFGISPTSIYKKGDGSVESGANVSSNGHYSGPLYADTYLWAKNGWIDYLMPQLYVSFLNGGNNFADLAEWYNRAFEGLDCNLYFGLANYKMLSDVGSWKYEEEMFNQLRYIQTLNNCKGVSLFSSTYLTRDSQDPTCSTYTLYQKLKNEFWTKKMSVPESRL